jgi:hypothetical protein
MNKEKDYNDACLKEVIELLESGNIDYKDFNKLQSAVKWHDYYDEDKPEIEFDDVLDYINWNMSHWERERLLEAMDVHEPETLKEWVGVLTLDDEYRFNLVMRLFKGSCSERELESFIKPEALEKIKHILADV